MNICMLLAGHDFPPDIRVEKEARSLIAAGHKVVIVCDHRNLDRPLEDSWNGCRVIRLPALPSRMSRRINLVVWLIRFLDRYWQDTISRLVEKDHIDVLHVHDLPMVRTALSVGKRYNIPVVADFHENYPAAIKYYKPVEFTFYDHVLNFFHPLIRWTAYERHCALAADKVLVVVDEAKKRLEKLGVPADQIAVIENTPDKDYFLGFSIDESIVSRYREDFVISYIGGFGGEHRGLDTAIAGMPDILKQIPNARLLLVGNGPIKPVLEKMIFERSLDDRVTFVDWQPFAKVPSFIEASTICLVPHNSNPHTEGTSPHKLFQYMLLRKPVVVSSCRPLKRVVEETGSGLVFDAGDSRSFAKVIIQLKDEKCQQRFGEAGYLAVQNKYNWESTSRALSKIYEQFHER